jgi:SAM-dependent methyltransferase
VGAGNGNLQDIFEDYIAIDITENSKKYFHKPYIVIKDGDVYPFENKTFDLIFTNAVFEHIPDINLALKEMIRVIKDDGYIIFNPAWQCRPWAAEGYPVRPYSDFNIWRKLYKLSIPLRENILFRLLHVMPTRLFYLIKYILNKDNFKGNLIYRKIEPNYEKFWMSDSDACNNIDPFIAILYFKANGFHIVNYPTIKDQFLVRTNELILKKNDKCE